MMFTTPRSKNRLTKDTVIFLLLASVWLCTPLQAELRAWALESAPAKEINEQGANADLAQDRQYSVEELKQQMLELNRDLLILEEDLLFPASTQISVFLSMDVGEFFQLDAVRLEIDGKEVAAHLYTERQLDALHRGGVQRLHLGNIKSGKHEVVAFFTGGGSHERDYKRAASIQIDKSEQALMLELIVQDSEQRLQPQFYFDHWTL